MSKPKIDVLAELELIRAYFSNRDESDCVARMVPLTAAVEELIDRLESAKWMLERDYIDDQKMAVIRKCEETLARTGGVK